MAHDAHEHARPSSLERTDPLARVIRLLLAVAGGGLLAVGAVAVFKTTNGPGSAALLATGAGLAFVAYAGERLKHVKAGAVEADFITRASALAEAANVADATGAPEVGDRLRSLALESLQQARQVARSYEDALREIAPGRDRLLKFVELWQDARSRAKEWRIGPEELRRMFDEGSDSERIVALALMMERPELRDLELVLQAIGDSHSGFEQYRALMVAQQLIPSLTNPQARRLREAIEEQEGAGGIIQPRESGWKLSRSILDGISSRP